MSHLPAVVAAHIEIPEVICEIVEGPTNIDALSITPISNNGKRCSILNRNKILENMRKDPLEYQREKLKIEEEKLLIKKERLEEVKKRNRLIEERNEILKNSEYNFCVQHLD